MMMSNRLMNSNNDAMSPAATDDVDFFAFATTMQMMQPYPGVEADDGMSMLPSVDRPVLQHHDDLIDYYDNNFDFGAAAFLFPFQQDTSLVLPPTSTSLQPLAPPPSMAMSMPLLPCSLQTMMPPLPGVVEADGMSVPSVDRSLLQHHDDLIDEVYGNFNFGAAGLFPFQQADTSLVLPPTLSTSLLPLAPPPMRSMATTSMPLLPSSLQTLPSVEADGMSVPSVERPLLQHHDLDNVVDFGTAGFPFQQDNTSLILPPNTTSLPPPRMAMPSTPLLLPCSLQTIPPPLYLFGSGSSSSSFLNYREDGPGAVLLDAGGGGDGGFVGMNLVDVDPRRTYFSPADALAVDRLLTTRARLGGGVGVGVGLDLDGLAGLLGLELGVAAHHYEPPRCQAEGCKADLSAAKHYHRRHKVCEYHAYATAVAGGGGKQQRFCQQYSRFHVVAEFDGSKRSCRKRLAEHNHRRRRKPATARGKDSSRRLPPQKADATSIITTTSYNSDHKNEAVASTAAAKSTAAISPNDGGTGVDGQQTSSVAPTAMPPAGMPLPAAAEMDGGGLQEDTETLMRQVHGRDNDDEQQHSMGSLMLLLQADQQHHHDGSSGGGSIFSRSSSVSDHQQQNGGCNGLFEADFI